MLTSRFPTVRPAFLLIGAISLAGAGAAGRRSDRISRPFTYSGYSAESWTGHRRWAEFVTMPDGVKIAVDVVLPTGYTGKGDSVTRFPVIFQYTPYGRSSFDP